MQIRDFVNKFKQPSSWAGLAAIGALFAPHIPIEYVVEAGAAICGLVAFFMNEKGPNA